MEQQCVCALCILTEERIPMSMAPPPSMVTLLSPVPYIQYYRERAGKENKLLFTRRSRQENNLEVSERLWRAIVVLLLDRARAFQEKELNRAAKSLWRAFSGVIFSAFFFSPPVIPSG